MKSHRLSRQMSSLIAGASLLLVLGCNKQPIPSGNGAAAEAPPIAALPLAASAVEPAAPAPPLSALAPAPQRIPFAPPPPRERYRYIDRAYAMGDAFADTPPDYTVDYGGTRPWIWRAGNGAYRIVERLPRGERIYYYDPGQDEPFLVRDPEYSYAYDGARLAGIYGPGGEEIDPAVAARRTDEASRYFARSLELYRAAQYQRRQAAYASEWAARRNELRAEHQAWEEQQSQNPDWRAWHDEHQTQDAGQWRQEREQRLAYASAIGISPASSGSLPSADELARRQAAYFAQHNEPGRQARQPQAAASAPSTPAAELPTKAAPPLVKGPAIPAQKAVNGENAQATATAGKAAPPRPIEMKGAKQAAAEARSNEAAAAQAKAVQAAQAQQRAAELQHKQAAMAAKAAQAATAERASAEAKRKEMARAQVKAGEIADAQKAAAKDKQRQAEAARAKAAEAKQKEVAAARAKAADAEKAAAEAKQKEVAAARAKAADAEKAAAEAKQKQAAAAEAKAAEARKAAADARQHATAAAEAKSEADAKAQKSPPQAHLPKGAAPAAKPVHNGSKGKGEEKKNHQVEEQ